MREGAPEDEVYYCDGCEPNGSATPTGDNLEMGCCEGHIARMSGHNGNAFVGPDVKTQQSNAYLGFQAGPPELLFFVDAVAKQLPSLS